MTPRRGDAATGPTWGSKSSGHDRRQKDGTIVARKARSTLQAGALTGLSDPRLGWLQLLRLTTYLTFFRWGTTCSPTLKVASYALRARSVVPTRLSAFSTSWPKRLNMDPWICG